MKGVRRFEGSISEFIRLEVGGFSTLLRFLQVWARNIDVPAAVTLVRYEDMHLNPLQELRRVLQFIGIHNIDTEVLDRAQSFCSFENMRRLERDARFRSRRLRPASISDEESYKTRKGKVGGYKEYLGTEDIHYLDRCMAEGLPPYYGYMPNFG
jgi:hypothetical protein